MTDLPDRLRKYEGSHWEDLDDEVTTELGRKGWQIACIIGTIAFVVYLFTL